MESKRFTKYHFMVILLILIIIATIAWAVISIHNISKEDEIIASEEVIIETQEINEIPDDYIEPDLTIQEYNIALYEAETNNKGRYSIEELNKILVNNIKANENVELSLLKSNPEKTIGFKNTEFTDYMTVWYPEEACIIIICKPDINIVSSITNWLREFSESQKKKMLDDTSKAIYIYYEDETYNGYRIIAMCDNAQVVVEKIIQYMQQEDAKKIDEFTSKYELNQYGAYLKEEKKSNE